MKKIFTPLVLSMLFIINMNAQTEVLFNINHKLGTQNFQFNTEKMNNLNHPFSVERLEYYISDITIIHDGGQESLVPNKYLLVNAEAPMTTSLGMHDLTNIEGVSFYVGVSPDVNHLDPASWPNTHPLAPKFPSMHWGWAAGYRFVAMEGKSGQGLGSTYQFHGLGDSNYNKTTVMLEATDDNGSLLINLDADYVQAVKGIGLLSGPISHGETGQAKTCVENFNSEVFSPAALSNSTQDFLSSSDFEIYPNPSTDQHVFIQSNNNDLISHININDIQGKLINRVTVNNQSTRLNFNGTGVYLVQIFNEKGEYYTEKIIIQN